VRLPPKCIEALYGAHVTSVAAGNYHTLALTRCGRVYSWSLMESGNWEIGRGNDSNDGESYDPFTPQVITTLLGKHVRAIAAGSDVSCAVTDAGALYT
jgi:alpha-tubulin suppressor-like RCC1 family protein